MSRDDHSGVGCMCARHVRKRELGREYEKNRRFDHPMKGCDCKRHQRFREIHNENTRRRRRKKQQTFISAELRGKIECAIARGMPSDRIIAETGCTPDQYTRVVNNMDLLVEEAG